MMFKELILFHVCSNTVRAIGFTHEFVHAFINGHKWFDESLHFPGMQMRQTHAPVVLVVMTLFVRTDRKQRGHTPHRPAHPPPKREHSGSEPSFTHTVTHTTLACTYESFPEGEEGSWTVRLLRRRQRRCGANGGHPGCVQACSMIRYDSLEHLCVYV